MTVTQAREDARLRRFVLRRHRLPVAGGVLSIVAPSSSSSPLQQQSLQRARSGGEPPYWAQIWPASVGLARWLCRRQDLDGRTVVDLGGGVGGAGAAAARCGAQVLACDLDADALAFAAFNLRHNQPPGAGAAVAGRQLDWQHETLTGDFDLLLLADVSYRPAHHLPILRQIEHCLGHDGIVLHCDPHRRESTGFLQLAAGRLAQQRLELSTSFDGERVPLRFVAMAREAGVLARFLSREPEVTA